MAKGIGAVIGGIISLCIAIWAGLIGYTTTEFTSGPEGYGLYEVQVTYPVVGIIFGIMGVLSLIGGLVQLSESMEPIPPPQLVVLKRNQIEPQQAQFYEPQPLLRCTNCENELDSDAAFCPNCGSAVSRREYIDQM